jgi:Flp pilus assembly protein TadG
MQIHFHPPHRRFQPRCGAAAVELAVVAPLVVGLLVGLLEVGQIVKVNQIVSNAAREGARSASTPITPITATGVNTYANVQTTVANYLTNAGITNQSGLTVTVSDVTQSNSGPQFDPSTANWLDQLQITVTLPYSNVQLAPLPIPANTVISAQAVWFSNQDQPYPTSTSITPPSGS